MENVSHSEKNQLRHNNLMAHRINGLLLFHFELISQKWCLEQNAVGKNLVKPSMNSNRHTDLVCSNVIRFPIVNDGFLIILFM